MLKFSPKLDKGNCPMYTRVTNGTESKYVFDHQRERLQGILPTANGSNTMETQK